MQLTLVNPKPELVAIFRREFAEHSEVRVCLGGVETLPAFDCFLTAGNSFGLMDGGVDRAVVRYFGREIEEAVQARILDEYLGEQPVGTCLLIETGRTDRPYIAHAPTMRAPMNISRTDHVYVAFWSALLEIRRHNRAGAHRTIQHLAAPALGTGAGCMEADEAALQMSLAWQHFHAPPSNIHPGLVRRRLDRIHYGGNRGFEHPRQPILRKGG